MKKQVCLVAAGSLAVSGCMIPPVWAPMEGGPELRAVDGGADYYGRFDISLPSSPDYFPVAVWLESVIEPGDIDRDRQMGLNTYAGLTRNSNMSQVIEEGAYAITEWAAEGASGYMLSDEVDMWGGPGSAPWSGRYPAEGDICEPTTARCGFTVQQTLLEPVPPRALVYSNYGKGVTFWELDAEARRFVNEFQSVVSADNYWFTDPGICGPSEGGAALNRSTELPSEELRLDGGAGTRPGRPGR
jgi:hypothetical protein